MQPPPSQVAVRTERSGQVLLANRWHPGEPRLGCAPGKELAPAKRFRSWAKPAHAGAFSSWTTPACEERWPLVQIGLGDTEKLEIQASVDPQFGNVDSLYLFACHVEGERRSEPSAAWELIAATQTGDTETRAPPQPLPPLPHKVPHLPLATL